jgi:hypothetical protein
MLVPTPCAYPGCYEAGIVHQMGVPEVYCPEHAEISILNYGRQPRNARLYCGDNVEVMRRLGVS